MRAYSSENVGEWSSPLTVTTLRGNASLNNEISVNAQNTKTYEIVIAGDNIYLDEVSVFTITYNPEHLTLVDFASHVVGTHLTTGQIPGTNIQILSISDGSIEFKFTKQIPEHQVWSGIFTIAKFQALSTRSTTIFFEQ